MSIEQTILSNEHWDGYVALFERYFKNVDIKVESADTLGLYFRLHLSTEVNGVVYTTSDSFEVKDFFNPVYLCHEIAQMSSMLGFKIFSNFVEVDKDLEELESVYVKYYLQENLHGEKERQAAYQVLKSHAEEKKLKGKVGA